MSEPRNGKVFGGKYNSKEEADQIFLVVEEQASFPGGMGEWNKFLRKNLKYPRQATLTVWQFLLFAQ